MQRCCWSLLLLIIQLGMCCIPVCFRGEDPVERLDSRNGTILIYATTQCNRDDCEQLVAWGWAHEKSGCRLSLKSHLLGSPSRYLLMGAVYRNSDLGGFVPTLVIRHIHAVIADFFNKEATDQTALVTSTVPPTNALMLGLGLGSSAQLLRTTWPTIGVDAVEILSEVVELGTEAFCMSEQINITIADAGHLSWLRPGLKYDIVIVDLFDVSGALPFTLAKWFLVALKSALSAHGVIVINLWPALHQRHHHTRLANASSVFGEGGLAVVHTRRSSPELLGNSLVVLRQTERTKMSHTKHYASLNDEV